MIDVRVIAKGLCHRVWTGLGLETEWAIINIHTRSQLTRSSLESNVWSVWGSHSKPRGRTEFGLGQVQF